MGDVGTGTLRVVDVRLWVEWWVCECASEWMAVTLHVELLLTICPPTCFEDANLNNMIDEVSLFGSWLSYGYDSWWSWEVTRGLDCSILVHMSSDCQCNDNEMVNEVKGDTWSYGDLMWVWGHAWRHVTIISPLFSWKSGHLRTSKSPPPRLLIGCFATCIFSDFSFEVSIFSDLNFSSPQFFSLFPSITLLCPFAPR